MGTDVMNKLQEANNYKEQGNAAFKNGDWAKAIALYSKAIGTLNDDSKDMAVYLKNRAAAYLKQEKFDEAIGDCNKSLEYAPMDPKALFRRCQGLEAMERFEESYRDAMELLKVDPSNKVIRPVLERLFKITQERARQSAQVVNKVDSMLKICFDAAGGKEKREAAFNNLLVLSREKAGSDVMMKKGVVREIARLLKAEKNNELRVTCIRIVGELCKHGATRTRLVLREVGVPWLVEILDSTHEEQVRAAQYCTQAILNAFSGMENGPDAKPVRATCDAHKAEIDALLTCLVGAINSHAISGLARDAVVELLMRNIHYSQLAWAERLVDVGGVERLLEVAAELDEYRHESAMHITPSTRTVAAVCLARVYENMYYDQARDNFVSHVEAFIKARLLAPEIEQKVRAVVAITALLRGPLDVGNAIVGKEGIMEMILVMANAQDELQQRVAVECVVAAASKKDKAKAIIAQGVDILKRLYLSAGDKVRVRALVGLCKLGSSGGSDASIKPFADGSNLKLAAACRRFLLHPGRDRDMGKWSAEGLSYLTLDAEVKEKLVEDEPALRALIELAKTGDQSVLYGVVTTLVNLCNAYEKQEMAPELVELAKFAKHHVPEEHAFDEPDFVAKRLHVLGRLGVTTALVALAKTESPNSRELIARVFNALCAEHELRGVVVSQGGARALLPFSLRGTDMGRRHAAQALSRIAITIDPAVAFPGQRSLEVIRPLLGLLAAECAALENFEALMALCNVAQMGEPQRQRMLKEGALSKIDHYLYEDHLMLCRAAAQATCNLALSDDVVRVYEGDNDRIKFLVALILDEDVETTLAAAGAVCILTDGSAKCCAKFFDAKSWQEALKYTLSHASVEVQHRGVVILRNLLGATKELAERIIATDVMEVIMAVTKLEGDARRKVVTIAEECLQIAESYGIIRKPDEVDPFLLAEQERRINALNAQEIGDAQVGSSA